MKPYFEKRRKNGREYFTWRVEWVLCGKRRKKTFNSLEKAKDWVRQYQKKCQEEGSISVAAWEDVPKKERIEILEARLLFPEKDGKREIPWLKMATDFNDKTINPQTLFRDEAAKVVEKVRKESKKGSTYPDTLQFCYGKICEVFGDRFLHEITRKQVWDYLHSQNWTPSTFNKYVGYFSLVYLGALDAERYIGKNPMLDILRKKMPKNETEMVVPDPATVHSIVEEAIKHPEKGVAGYFILSFGFGCRTTEIKRLRPGDIVFGERGTLRITAGAAKTSARRVIQLRDPIFGYWGPLLEKVITDNPVLIPKNFEENRDWVCKKAGVIWEQNMGRHSASTYHFNFYNSSKDTIAFLGHDTSAATFEKNYRAIDLQENGLLRPVGPEDAEAYWRMPLPTK